MIAGKRSACWGAIAIPLSGILRTRWGFIPQWEQLIECKSSDAAARLIEDSKMMTRLIVYSCKTMSALSRWYFVSCVPHFAAIEVRYVDCRPVWCCQEARRAERRLRRVPPVYA